MGVRTYIYGFNSANIKDFLCTEAKNACLGKMAAYVDRCDIPNLESVQWLEKHLKNEEDKEYLEQYKDIGYCNEYIVFNQVFTHEEILEFVEAYYNDKASKSPWQNVCGLSNLILLLENYKHFVIEWVG